MCGVPEAQLRLFCERAVAETGVEGGCPGLQTIPLIDVNNRAATTSCLQMGCTDVDLDIQGGAM
jgi:hypothetical protein